MQLDMYEDDDIIGQPMIDLIFNQIGDLTNRIYEEFPGAEMLDWLSTLIHAPPAAPARASAQVLSETEKNILNPLLEWCDSEYGRLDDPSRYKDDWINPKKAVFSVATAIDICNRMRHSMKLPIKILTHQLKELKIKINGKHILEDEVLNAYATIDEVNNVLTENYVQLTRNVL